MDEFEYSNGADGTCQECGEPTEEEWHAYCSDCFAEQQGWRRPDAAALEFQRDDRVRVSIAELVARVAELERAAELQAQRNELALRRRRALAEQFGRRIDALEAELRALLVERRAA